MIRRGADVPGVDVPAERDPPGGGPDDGGGVHDGGVLAAELEHGRGEVPGGCLVHDLADLRAAETLAYGLLLATTACLEPALA